MSKGLISATDHPPPPCLLKRPGSNSREPPRALHLLAEDDVEVQAGVNPEDACPERGERAVD